MLVSLYFALEPGDERDDADDDRDDERRRPRPRLPATTEAAATTTAPAEPQVVRITVSVPGDKAPTVPSTSPRQGSEVVLTVTSEVADEVHVHGYDLMADVAPGAPATIRFTANAPGRFEIELENTGVQIAELEVRP